MMDKLVRERGGAGRGRGGFKREITQTSAVMQRMGMLGNRTCGDLIAKKDLQRLPKHGFVFIQLALEVYYKTRCSDQGAGL